MIQTQLLRLMMLLSPSFPVGGFAYSSALEQAAADGLVSNPDELGDWLEATLQSGSLYNDAILLVQAHCGQIDEANEMALALAGSKERYLEATAQGVAFVAAVRAANLPCPALPEPIAYSISVGAVAAVQDIAAEDAVGAFLHAFLSNQIQCAIRLGITGQYGGVALLAQLENRIAGLSSGLAASTLDDLGSNTIMADISSKRHEALGSRIFRT